MRFVHCWHRVSFVGGGGERGGGGELQLWQLTRSSSRLDTVQLRKIVTIQMLTSNSELSTEAVSMVTFRF